MLKQYKASELHIVADEQSKYGHPRIPRYFTIVGLRRHNDSIA